MTILSDRDGEQHAGGDDLAHASGSSAFDSERMCAQEAPEDQLVSVRRPVVHPSLQCTTQQPVVGAFLEAEINCDVLQMSEHLFGSRNLASVTGSLIKPHVRATCVLSPRQAEVAINCTDQAHTFQTGECWASSRAHRLQTHGSVNLHSVGSAWVKDLATFCEVWERGNGVLLPAQLQRLHTAEDVQQQ